MITIQLYNPIANKDNAWWYSCDGTDGVFSLDFVKSIFERHSTESDFKFNIHCNGGEVEEGFAIYDFLRTSGKNIHTNIEGSCHSMAVTLLLAAPKENRSANPNCLALIHQVQGGGYGSTTSVEARATEMRMLQDKMLDIYADRTGTDRSKLEEIMLEEREHNAQELKKLGFVSKINVYNTNFKPSINFKNDENMKKNANEVKKTASSLINAIQRFIGGNRNYEFVDKDGEVLFTTSEDSDVLEVGMSATPDGTHVIADGRTVIVVNSEITEIQDPSGSSSDGELEELKKEVEELKEENEEMKEMLENSADVIRALRSQLKSNYVPAGRVGSTGNRSKVQGSRKEEIREKLKSNRV